MYADDHRNSAINELEAGTITVYRFNKITYDIVHWVEKNQRSVTITRDGKPLAMLSPVSHE